VFLTGLTTGGLTCLAVQGGLLATAITRQASLPAPAGRAAQRAPRRARAAQAQTGIMIARDGWPVVYFLAAKLAAYTVLGFLLGWLGSAVQLTPTVQAIMQIAAGLYMLATALNMLNVHPLFRYVVLQPPRALTRLVRDQSKSEKVYAPVLLGLLTVLIPCGTTQAMMVLAISTGSALLGALTLFAFVLGTSPTFFVLGFLLTQARGKLKQALTVGAAVLILALGVVSVNAGLRLLDSPLAPSTILSSVLYPSTGEAPATAGADGVQEVTINVLDTGYAPNRLTAASGQPIRLRLMTDNTYGCARAFTIPSLGVSELLPETGVTLVNLPAQAPGQIRFVCSMGMYGGILEITQ
jgi:sulfite exporter TauE/SafE